jgi:hypothetical protein
MVWRGEVRFLAGQEIFLYSTASTPALGPTESPIQWVPGALSPEIKQPGSEADLSSPSSAEVKSGGAKPQSPYVLMVWCLIN